MPTGIMDKQSWLHSQTGRNFLQDYFNTLPGDGLKKMGAFIGNPNGLKDYIDSEYNFYTKDNANQSTMIQHSEDQGDRMGLLGDRYSKLADELRSAGSATNQFNLRNISAQMNANQPKYGEIAAAQGLSGSVTGMQEAAARRNAGLLTNANFGAMMQDNQKTALGYYGQAGQAYGQQGNEYAQATQANQGLMNLQMQDRWKQAELRQQQAQFAQSQGSIWDDILTTGLGVAGTVLGGPAGGAAGGLLGKWLGGGNTNSGTPAPDEYDPRRYYG